ncbi:MAG TPA: DUF6029 family protein [Bacteroidia bacterium]|nr:DUF6029 family protein [Bacteroidia bacterium]
MINKIQTLKISSIIALLFLINNAKAQQGISGIHGNFQTDIQYYNPDSAINAPAVPEKVLANSFLNLVYSSENFSAGIRYESFLNALQGYDQRYKGNGFFYRYASYTKDDLEVTAGNFYDQFGYGLIFRSYQEWGLGYDNAMDGIRVKFKPHDGVYLKGLVAKQRSFFDYGPGLVRGADGEFNINEIFTSLAEKKTKIILGGSFISKFQADNDPIYKLPENVSAYAGRLNLSRGNFNLGGEFAYKINDPSSVNNFIYKNGQALFLTAAYTQKGFGATLAVKRIDNMNFRSDRTAIITNLSLNFLPATTKSQTYLLANIYPYATQPNGEMGGQAEVFYNFRPESKLGGKYGTNISLNYSRVNSIDTVALDDERGYESDFLKLGDETFFQEINVEINKKFSKDFKLILTYINQIYNIDVVQGLVGHGTVYDHIGIAEINYKFNAKHSMRIELQHLYAEQDAKNWAVVLAEYNIAPHWFVAAFDEYNYGNDDKDLRIHYFSGSLGYTKGVTRIAAGYGKQRQGLLCVGGVCRQVPASNGYTLSITSSF